MSCIGEKLRKLALERERPKSSMKDISMQFINHHTDDWMERMTKAVEKGFKSTWVYSYEYNERLDIETMKSDRNGKLIRTIIMSDEFRTMIHEWAMKNKLAVSIKKRLHTSSTWVISVSWHDDAIFGLRNFVASKKKADQADQADSDSDSTSDS